MSTTDHDRRTCNEHQRAHRLELLNLLKNRELLVHTFRPATRSSLPRRAPHRRGFGGLDRSHPCRQRLKLTPERSCQFWNAEVSRLLRHASTVEAILKVAEVRVAALHASRQPERSSSSIQPLLLDELHVPLVFLLDPGRNCHQCAFLHPVGPIWIPSK